MAKIQARGAHEVARILTHPREVKSGVGNFFTEEEFLFRSDGKVLRRWRETTETGARVDKWRTWIVAGNCKKEVSTKHEAIVFLTYVAVKVRGLSVKEAK